MVKFQRRHYIAFAEIIRAEYEALGAQQNCFAVAEINGFVERTIKLFTEDNPRFNRDRFIAAIGGLR